MSFIILAYIYFIRLANNESSGDAKFQDEFFRRFKEKLYQINVSGLNHPQHSNGSVRSHVGLTYYGLLTCGTSVERASLIYIQKALCVTFNLDKLGAKVNKLDSRAK